MVIQAVNIVLGLFQLINGNAGSLLSIVIAGAITYYLFRPEIKAAFGRTLALSRSRRSAGRHPAGPSIPSG